MRRLFLLLPLLCLGWKPLSVSDRVDSRDISAINQNFDRLDYEKSNYVTKSGTQTIVGYKAFESISISTLTVTGRADIVGTNTNDDAAPGRWGQQISSVSLTKNCVTSGQAGDLVSISLAAGDWDVSGIVGFFNNGATWTLALMAISTSTGNNLGGTVYADSYVQNKFASSSTTPLHVSLSIPSLRMSLSTPKTIYLKYYSEYSAGTPQAYGGRISARRAR